MPIRKEHIDRTRGTFVDTVAELRAALAEAEAKFWASQDHLQEAQRHLNGVIDRITAADGTTTPDDLSRAKAAVEHAELALPATEQAMHEARERLRAEEIEIACSKRVGEIRHRGSLVSDTLPPLEAALAAFAEAALAYDQTVRQALNDPAVTNDNPRVSCGPYTRTRIDDVFVESCRPTGQLCRLLAPALRQLGAPQSLVGELKMHAAGAPDIPTLEDR